MTAEALLVTASGSASLGCFGFGPQAGITFDGNPTLGWEASALSVSTGQSYRLGRRARREDEDSTQAILKRPWDKRTYVVWEPGFGAPLRTTSDNSSAVLAGGGFSLGGRWDVRETTSDQGEGRKVVDAAAIAGFWAGTNDSVPQRRTEKGSTGRGGEKETLLILQIPPPLLVSL
jgi:hypothetical protein